MSRSLRAALDLAPEPRRVALGLGEYDSVRVFSDNPTMSVRIGQIADVRFRYEQYREAIGLYVQADGSFSVCMSACVDTDTAPEHLAAFTRASNFILNFGLRPAQ